MKKNCCEIDDAVYPQEGMKSAEGVIPGTHQSGHPCCNVKVKVRENTSICKECSNKEISVEKILNSLVKEPALETIESPDGFYFCETPTCEVVYFNNEQQVYLHKDDVKVRVGIRETEDPVPVRYCFDWTQQRIFEQIKQQGYSIAVQEIGAEVKAGECACDINKTLLEDCLGMSIKLSKEEWNYMV